MESESGKGQNQLSRRTQANKSKWHMLEIRNQQSRQCSGTKIQTIRKKKH